MATDTRALERVLHAIDGGLITRGDDWVYRNNRGQDMDDAVYAADGRGWVELLTDGRPQVTEKGRRWLTSRPQRAERMPVAPVFAEAGNG